MVYFSIIIIFLSSTVFLQNQHLLENSFSNTSRAQLSLHPDQARQNVEPDLGPNCLQTRGTSRQKVKSWRLLCIFVAKFNFFQI